MCYYGNNKYPKPGIHNWGNTQGDLQQKSGKGGSEPEVQEQILSIPDKVTQEGFDIEMTPEETAKESNRDDQLFQCLMGSMQ